MKDIKYEIEEYPYNDLEMYRTDLSELAEIIGDMLKKNETNKPKKTKKELLQLRLLLIVPAKEKKEKPVVED